MYNHLHTNISNIHVHIIVLQITVPTSCGLVYVYDNHSMDIFAQGYRISCLCNIVLQ